MTGEISGLEPSCSASPAHSESISAVSGALDVAGDGRLEGSSNDGREGTGEARSLPALAGLEDVTVGVAAGAPASCPDPDFSGLSLVLEPFFFPRRPCALIALRGTIWRVFAKKARKVRAKTRPFAADDSAIGATHCPIGRSRRPRVPGQSGLKRHVFEAEGFRDGGVRDLVAMYVHGRRQLRILPGRGVETAPRDLQSVR